MDKAVLVTGSRADRPCGGRTWKEENYLSLLQVRLHHGEITKERLGLTPVSFFSQQFTVNRVVYNKKPHFRRSEVLVRGTGLEFEKEDF